jgi:hypothetical protein
VFSPIRIIGDCNIGRRKKDVVTKISSRSSAAVFQSAAELGLCRCATEAAPAEALSGCQRQLSRAARTRASDGDRNAEHSNANKFFADRRITGDRVKAPAENRPRRPTTARICGRRICPPGAWVVCSGVDHRVREKSISPVTPGGAPQWEKSMSPSRICRCTTDSPASVRPCRPSCVPFPSCVGLISSARRRRRR